MTITEFTVKVCETMKKKKICGTLCDTVNGQNGKVGDRISIDPF